MELRYCDSAGSRCNWQCFGLGLSGFRTAGAERGEVLTDIRSGRRVKIMWGASV